MRVFPWRLVLVVATAVSVIAYSEPASATTVNLTIGPGRNLVFDPASVTIHPGDQVKWNWGSNFHSTKSGSPALPNNDHLLGPLDDEAPNHYVVRCLDKAANADVVRGVSNTTGVALVEVYDLQ